MQQHSGRVLIVDDDAAIRSTLRAILEFDDFQVEEAPGGEEMHQRMGEANFDLITLDIGMPGKSGLEIARELRQQSNIPIIVVSARSTDVDRIVGLEIGADDYIIKPFNVREVVARVRAVLRRAKENVRTTTVNSHMIMFNGFEYNTQTRKLSCGQGPAIVLTSAEADLLEFLFRNAGRTCSRDEITAALKGHEWSPFDRSLDTLIGRLRKKIEPDSDNPTIILSVRGVGYRLSADTNAVPPR